MSERRRWETRAFSTALETYLAARGWTGVKYTEDYEGGALVLPTINTLIADNGVRDLELGRTTTSSKLFRRIIQVDIYAESEHRADAMSDDVMDFMDLTAVYITDLTNTIIGSLICNETQSIRTEKQPPVFAQPDVIHWRAITKARFEAHYPNG